MRLLAFSTLLGLLAGHCSAYVVHPKDTKTIFETQQLNLPYVQQKVTQSKPCKGSQPQKSPLPRDVTRKKWGIDKDHHEEYWFNKSIHTLGNTGFFGAIHAAMAPTSTRLIDLLAYNGVDIRAKVAQELAQSFRNSKVRVLDIACGVGFSTRALRDAFPKAELVVGIDTSPEMIQMARLIAFQDSIVRPFMAFADKHMKGVQESIKIRGQAAKKAYDEAARSAIATFQKTNAEHTPFPSRSFDLVTIM
jgi:SAM-dependent methyltransferase